jgi:hypothetical protein
VYRAIHKCVFPAAGASSADEAAARYLRIRGLAGLLTAADPAVDAGLRGSTADGSWPWIGRVCRRSARHNATGGTVPDPGHPCPRRARQDEHRRAPNSAGRPPGYAPGRAGPGAAGNLYIREDRILPHLPAPHLLLTGAVPATASMSTADSQIGQFPPDRHFAAALPAAQAE